MSGAKTRAKRLKKSVYNKAIHHKRIIFIGTCIALIATTLMWRLVDLKVFNQEFLQDKSNQRVVRHISTPANRGDIFDRNGEPLAISTPVISVWANPLQLNLKEKSKIYKLADILKRNRWQLWNNLKKKKKRSFVYLKRRIDPQLKDKIKALDLSGIFIQQEYRRYYPASQATGHIIGFTNIDGKGLEGIELIYDEVLTGQKGHQRVIRNRLGQIIAIDENQVLPKPGENIHLSLDKRIQYLAYAELKHAIKKHQAKSGSVVVVDINTGEVLALVNQPGFNPNKLSDRKAKNYKNRAMTDQFEPGSTMKPFTIMAALESKRYAPSTMIETGDGWFMVGRKTIKDSHAYGLIDLSTVLQKSSNVGSAKIALNLPKEILWDTFASFGFGEDTGSLFYGETSGKLNRPRRISKVTQATISYGYGMTASAIQLAQAYSTIARYGNRIPINLLRTEEDSDAPTTIGQANISQRNIKRVIKMMEGVVKKGGTAPQANIPGYRVAGKTGTSKKSSKSGGYTEKTYTASFVGFAPVSKPQIAIAVVVDDPEQNGFYGGVVSGPVFQKVMSGALRLLNISPDAVKRKTGIKGIAKQIELKLEQQHIQQLAKQSIN